jgi:hypothetical protein
VSEPRVPDPEHPELRGWQRFLGTWSTAATHPAFPGTVVQGHCSFEWLAGRRFLIHRSQHEHPQFPDAISIIGFTDARLSMHYFDSRGVHRVYKVSFDAGTWRICRNAPAFSQRFTGTFSDDDTTISGQWELCQDQATWRDDLAITYRRHPPEALKAVGLEE